MSKLNQVKAEEEVLTPAEIAEKERKGKEDSVKKMLNNQAFLSFLAKIPDSVDNGENNDYLAEKVEIFERVQAVKQDAKKFIVGASSTEFGNLVDDELISHLEKMAIDDPVQFTEFSQKISDYLVSVANAKAIENVYQETSNKLGIGVNYAGLNDNEKRAFVRLVHTKVELGTRDVQAELDEKTSVTFRGFSTYIPYMKARQDYKRDIAEKTKLLQGFKAAFQKLDQDAITKTIDDIESIKATLKSNQAFDYICKEFQKKVTEKVAAAKYLKNDSSLAKYASVLQGLKANGSILEDGECDDLSKGIQEYSKETLSRGTDDMVKIENPTLGSFEKAVESMRKKGISMGLNETECNEQIATVLKDKITELQKDQATNPQSRIKLILARRILINIE